MTPTNDYLIIEDVKEEQTTASGLIIAPDSGAANKAVVLESSNNDYAKGATVYYPDQAARKLYDTLKVIKSEAVFAVK